MTDQADEIRKCKDCRNDFNFSVGEAKFYEEKGFKPPQRCKPCRQARKAAQAYLAENK